MSYDWNRTLGIVGTCLDHFLPGRWSKLSVMPEYPAAAALARDPFVGALLGRPQRALRLPDPAMPVARALGGHLAAAGAERQGRVARGPGRGLCVRPALRAVRPPRPSSSQRMANCHGLVQPLHHMVGVACQDVSDRGGLRVRGREDFVGVSVRAEGQGNMRHGRAELLAATHEAAAHVLQRHEQQRALPGLGSARLPPCGRAARQRPAAQLHARLTDIRGPGERELHWPQHHVAVGVQPQLQTWPLDVLEARDEGQRVAKAPGALAGAGPSGRALCKVCELCLLVRATKRDL
mmetsp:Transcript_53050/g.151109  ORF Transcript_53050/g.151109 Transcript_53050/m.151109 type:complete len:293 (+) Transcript_53050:195-1073(+)